MAEYIKKIKNTGIKKRDEVCRRVIECGILGLIVFSPLPSASVYEWSILVIQLTVLVMMMAYLIMDQKPQTHKLLFNSLKWPKYLFLALFAFLFIQVIPLPKFLVKVFSPLTYSFQQGYLPDFTGTGFISLSFIPSDTIQKGLELLSYFLLGFLVIKTVAERRQIKRIFSVLIAMGVFEAFYGMFELYNKNPRILFYKKIHYLDSVTGTFVNRNHLSGYLEMIIPLAIAFIIAKINLFSLEDLKWRNKLRRLSEKGLSSNLLVSFSIIIMSTGIIFSKSRSGIFLLLIIFVLFFGLTMLYFKKTETRKKGIINFMRVLFLIIIFISLYIGIEASLERFTPEELSKTGRPIYWATTTRIFTQFPIFGTGLGTFSSLYPDWYSGDTIIRLYHAHNDYLEYLLELGIVGMSFLLGGILIIGITTFKTWKERRHPEIKGLALGGIVSIVCIMIHSITDFNMHIPANMLLFSVVLSITFVTVFYKKGEIKETQKSDLPFKNKLMKKNKNLMP